MARKIIIDEDEEDELEEQGSDVQVSDDEAEAVDVEEEPAMPDEEDVVEAEEDEMFSDAKDDELDDEEEGSELDALSSPPENTAPPTPQPKLKIKLKLPALSSATTATPTPEVSRAASRRGASRDVDIESEDSDSDDVSVAPSGRALTARQAVLRNVVDPSHVSLEEPPNPRKKKPLTEIEIALKREETARKRKNLSEKKLEDEKAETINRLLKKQSRSKGKRNALSTAEDRPTPLSSTAYNAADVDAQENGDSAIVPKPVTPTMYRWVSSSTTIPAAPDSKDETETRVMTLSFSVPVSVLPQVEVETMGPPPMDVDRQIAPPIRKIPECDVEGCTAKRKYRLVRDWQRGACGMEHLKELEEAVIMGRVR